MYLHTSLEHLFSKARMRIHYSLIEESAGRGRFYFIRNLDQVPSFRCYNGERCVCVCVHKFRFKATSLPRFVAKFRTNDVFESDRSPSVCRQVCAEEENQRSFTEKRKSIRLSSRRSRLWTTTGARPDLDEISADPQYKPKFKISSFLSTHHVSVSRTYAVHCGGDAEVGCCALRCCCCCSRGCWRGHRSHCCQTSRALALRMILVQPIT